MIFWKWLHTIFGKISSKTTIEETIKHGQCSEPSQPQKKDEATSCGQHVEDAQISNSSLLVAERLALLKSEYKQLCAKLYDAEKKFNQNNVGNLCELPELPQYTSDKICIRTFTPFTLIDFPNMALIKEARKEEEIYQIKLKEQEVTKHLGLASDYIGVGDCVKAHEELIIAARIIHAIDKPDIEHRYNNLSNALIRKENEYRILKRAKIAQDRKNKKKEKEEKKRLLFNIQHKNTRFKSGCKIAINDFIAHGIPHLYHFTSKANLKSIIDHGGLYARAYHSKVGISVEDEIPDPIIGSIFEVDIPNYICLSVCKEHYMARKQFDDGVDVCILKISLDVVKYYSTYFTDKDISEENIRIGRECHDTTNINFEAVKNDNLTVTDIDYSQKFATVLVDGFIPLSMIENIDNPIKLK